MKNWPDPESFMLWEADRLLEEFIQNITVDSNMGNCLLPNIVINNLTSISYCSYKILAAGIDIRTNSFGSSLIFV